MLHAPTTDFHSSQQLLQDAHRLIATAEALLAYSRKLIARGEARARARARASMAYDKIAGTPPTHGTIASDSSRWLVLSPQTSLCNICCERCRNACACWRKRCDWWRRRWDNARSVAVIS